MPRFVPFARLYIVFTSSNQTPLWHFLTESHELVEEHRTYPAG